MSERPAVSIVVPFYDSERHLAACIESLLAQEAAGPFEIILVDNGSTDASPAIAARYRDVTLLAEPTPGAYVARNTGIRTARAPLIAFTDADCIVSPGWLRSMRQGMEDPAAGILVGSCRFPRGASLGLRVLGAYEDAKAEYVIERCPAEHHYAYANNMAVRAAVFESIGPFREWPRAADSELVHRMRALRPDLRLAYRRSMAVTHMEFLHSRDRLRRLSLYRHTNARIGTFRELGLRRRLGLIGHAVTRAAGWPVERS